MNGPVALVGGGAVGSLFLFAQNGATSDVQIAALVGITVCLVAALLWLVMDDV